jgi:hypothetical protein
MEGVTIFSGATGNIPVYSGKREPVSLPEKMCRAVKVSSSGYCYWLKASA